MTDVIFRPSCISITNTRNCVALFFSPEISNFQSIFFFQKRISGFLQFRLTCFLLKFRVHVQKFINLKRVKCQHGAARGSHRRPRQRRKWCQDKDEGQKEYTVCVLHIFFPPQVLYPVQALHATSCRLAWVLRFCVEQDTNSWKGRTQNT